MKWIFSFFFMLFVFFSFSSKTLAASWYYPMDKISERATLKGFGTLANDAFYKGRENLFPTKFYGYHAGQDLESLSSEKADSVLVPFYAVTDGTIIYIGTLKGYGGVILERLDDGQHVALYGHIKIPNNLNINNRIKAGDLISYLGNNFSIETSGERKHLHFAIHKGTDEYFHGHEPNVSILNSQWEDPILFLKNLGAIEPGSKSSPVTSSSNLSNTNNLLQKKNQSFLSWIIEFFKKLLGR